MNLSFTPCLTALLFFCFIKAILCRSGCDLSVATTSGSWNCLTTSYNVTYTIVRTYRNLGEVDTNSANSIILAGQAGIKDIGAYIFPCITSAAYSIAHNITCSAPDEQVEAVLKYLVTNGVSVKGHSVPSDKNSKGHINRIWLDIEDESPSKYYDSNPKVNQDFIAAMVAALNARKIPVGIYTTLTYWTNIMGGVTGYSQYPLWYPRYDGVKSMDFFSPFAGWTDVQIKQIAGSSGWCDLGQVDQDYMLD